MGARVHLDHNATTPLRPEARARLLEVQDGLGGNPSSVHAAGRAARALLDDARERTAAALGVSEDEIVFTSGGTESDNLAVLGAVRASDRGRGLLTSAIEHSAVLGAADALAAEGRPVARLGVDREGRVDLDELARRAAAPSVGLVSIHAANNEVGTVVPLDRLAAAVGTLGRARPRLHTDAVQALGRIPLPLREVDLASFSAHKVGGPLGVGVLYRRRGVALAPLCHGGGQEGGLRPGTENVPGIAAAAVAIELAVAERAAYHARTLALARELWRGIVAAVPSARLAGPPLDAPDRLPNTLAVLLGGLDSRVLVARLDLEGLEASAGSACASGSIEPSHVLLAMGHPAELARGGLRLSLGRTTSSPDIHTAVEILSRTFGSAR